MLSDFSNLDENCLYDIIPDLVRIEYPGNVKNVDHAIETLGGKHAIEYATEQNSKLELRFHPKNRYSKGCTADRDSSCGILLKVIKGTSQENNSYYKYEVVGATDTNFKFSRLIDFQYLPLIPQKDEHGEETSAKYIYDQILPQTIPDMEWFMRKENMDQELFMTPFCYSRVSTPHRLYISTSERYGNANTSKLSKSSRKTNVHVKHSATFVDLHKADVVIPDQPHSALMEIIKKRRLETQYEILRKLFQERPMWTKAAILYNSKMSLDFLRLLLPAVSYFCNVGPFRNCWIRFGYNPMTDYNSRIYQTLDYRIRTLEGTKLKVEAKRTYSRKTRNQMSKVDSKQIFSVVNTHHNLNFEERSYILKPDLIPPARQMFYQFCDIQIPEIQDMVTKLPRLPPSAKYDFKNGWLPSNFIEQCREIANRYVLKCVKNSVLIDLEKQREQPGKSGQQVINRKEKGHGTTYCSAMLNNIRRGIYKSVDASSLNVQGSIIELDESRDGEDSDHGEYIDVEVNEVMDSIPERIEDLDEDVSDMEIDFEAAEEVNNIISGIQDVMK